MINRMGNSSSGRWLKHGAYGCRLLIAFLGGLFISGCQPTEEEVKQRHLAALERQKEKCLNTICEGDVLPQYDPKSEALFKIDGQIFIAPRAYGGVTGSLAFFWPSKTPARSKHALEHAPEFRPRQPDRNSNFYDVAIEIFLSPTQRQGPAITGYEVLRQLEAEGKVLSKETIKEGLEAWHTKDRTDEVWYVATHLQDEKGNPPVAACRVGDPEYYRCNSGFVWRPGIVAGMRFRAKHGPDWPGIYLETLRVLTLIKRG